MKKNIFTLLRTLLLVLAMMAGGAGSAAAQTVNDYFSVTNYPGTPDESISYYETFDGAYWVAADGDLITLLKDYTAPDYVAIEKSITLDLNDHTITGAVQDHLISVRNGATLEIVDNGTDSDTKGTITNSHASAISAICVFNGGTLQASVVSIACPNGNAIYNRGTADVNGCELSGYMGIDSKGTTTVSGTSISGTYFGIFVSVGTTTIGSGVSISGYSHSGIDYYDGTVILKALPTFKDQGNGYMADIDINHGLSLTFGEGTFSAENPKIKLYLCDSNGYPVDPATYTNAFTVGYVANVKLNGNVIDPNDIFAWYDGDYTDGFRTDAAGEVVFGAVEATVTACNTNSAPTIVGYTTLATAFTLAQAGYVAGNGSDVAEFIPTVTLLADVDNITSRLDIGDGITTTKVKLDLNDHKITGAVNGNLFSVKYKATLEIVNSGTKAAKDVTITNGHDDAKSAIYVDGGGMLTASGVSIVGGKGSAIRNSGTADVNGCELSGYMGIESYRTTTVTGTNTSGTKYGIYVYDGTTTIGEGVSISGYSDSGIFYYGDAVILHALPTFSGAGGNDCYDIYICNELSLTFGEGTFSAENPKIKLRIEDNYGHPVNPATYTKAITVGYAANVTDANGVIDPNDVFEWYDGNYTDDFRTDAAGEVVFGCVKASVSTYKANSTPTIANYTTLADAITAANEGYKTAAQTGGAEFVPTVTLLANDDDITEGYTIGDGSTTTKVTLDLNDHKITGAVEGDLISVNSGATLEIVDNGTDSDTKGTITNSHNDASSAICVNGGCTLQASGVSIDCDKRFAIFNSGTADVNGCELSGYRGIDSYGTTTVSGTSISGTDRGILVYDGTTTIGSGVSISGYSHSGIYYYDGTVILKALPTFNDQGNGYRADIYIEYGHSLTFGEGTFSAKNPKIKLYLRDSNGYPVTPATYTNTIATGYGEAFTVNDVTVDPNEVFEWFDTRYPLCFGVNGVGNMVFAPGAVSVTAYNAGSAPTITKYFTLADAIAAANDGYVAGNGGSVAEFIPTVTLLADVGNITARLDIGDGSTTTKMKLDLNDHTITGAVQGNLISVKNGATLEIVDNGTDTDTKGTITNNYNSFINAIDVNDGGTLHASGVRIACPNGYAIYNDGTADINDCELSGYRGIDSYGTITVSGTSISGTDRGIDVYDGTTTIGSGVSISGYSNSGIYYYDGTVILKALPTFNDQGNGYRADIYIDRGHSLTFGEGTFSAVNPKIKLYLKDSNYTTVNPTTYTNAIAKGYRANVKLNGIMIDPNEVFEWYDEYYTRGFVVNADGEVIFYLGALSVTVDDGSSTSTIGYYATLDEALAAAAEAYVAPSSSTSAVVPKVTLFDDVNCGESQIKLGSEGYYCDLVLDLNGHTLSGNLNFLIVVVGGRTLTVEDSGEGGRIVNTGTLAIYNSGTLNLHGVTIGGYDVSIENHRTMTVSGGTIDVSHAAYGIDNSGMLTFNGLPKFKHGTNSVNADILLGNDKIITFGAGTYEAPENPIVIKTSDLPPYTFTSFYGKYVRDAEDNVIDPGKIFVAKNKTSGDVIEFTEDKSEAVVNRYSTDFSLSDNDDNSSEIKLNRYGTATLAGRTITKDGTWNTLCLPFDVTLSGSPLQGFTVKELNASTSSLNVSGLLTINFTAVTDKIKAGKPYILKWEGESAAALTETNLVFPNVTITSTEPEAVTFSNANGEDCKFVGQYSPFLISNDDAALGFYTVHGHIDEILFFAKGDATVPTVLGYSASERTLRACRTHFWAPVLQTAGGEPVSPVRSFVLDFGDGNDATGIVELKNSRIEELNSDDGWYSMDGRRLPGKPAQKGVYIHQGRKIVVR